MTAARKLTMTACAFAVVLALVRSLGIVCLHYPRRIENNPFVAPVSVTYCTSDTIYLADGRTFCIPFADKLEDTISKSDFQVDVEPAGEVVVIYVKHRNWLCGTPWAALLEIPLIPDDVPINTRRMLIGDEICDEQLNDFRHDRR